MMSTSMEHHVLSTEFLDLPQTCAFPSPYRHFLRRTWVLSKAIGFGGSCRVNSLTWFLGQKIKVPFHPRVEQKTYWYIKHRTRMESRKDGA
ncbi:hypothetical protein HYALB_00005800 [Hymenoscyphus albidus]|uniref:Uncharacterized protein n=1 Tax=Hymenoscyphus albidus TaxID=595503 RepID=A0A9N9LLH5_9HELO|nr:hypothetical protein HYALB_00005800 [Hymenoscyphus albidus]